MTKQDIAENIKNQTGLNMKESQDMLEAVLEIMKATLQSGENIKISGFGTFKVKQKNARRGRNPQTGENIVLGPRRVVTYAVSASVRNLINGEKQYIQDVIEAEE